MKSYCTGEDTPKLGKVFNFAIMTLDFVSDVLLLFVLYHKSKTELLLCSLIFLILSMMVNGGVGMDRAVGPLISAEAGPIRC